LKQFSEDRPTASKEGRAAGASQAMLWRYSVADLD
jgi:hypothetical protein